MNIVLGHFALSEVCFINTTFPELDQFLSAGFIILTFYFEKKPKSLIMSYNYRRRTIFLNLQL
jgi:hypothetical protein